jgi:hypothetical protein
LTSLTATSLRPASSEHDPVRIWSRGIEQLDLQSHDRVQADLLRGGDETDGSVQPGMVGHSQARQAQLDRSRHEIVRRRGSIEEREVGVAVKLGVGK